MDITKSLIIFTGKFDMTANELRIGNFLIELGNSPDPLKRIFNITAIYGRNTERFVVEDDNGDIMSASFLTGIPLTEEWFLKFGFEYSEARKSESDGFDEWHKDGCFLGDFNGECFIMDALDQAGISVRLEYVHQLQNLFFVLTGTELEIKE